MKPGRRGTREHGNREGHSTTDLQHKWQKIKLATPGWVQTAASIFGQPQGMSTQQSVTPKNPRAAVYWNNNTHVRLKWSVLALAEFSWDSSCLKETVQLLRKSWCNNTVTSTWACQSKACMGSHHQLLVPHGIQLTLISNPYKGRHEFQHIVFCSMVKAATMTFIKAQKELHHSSHKTESTFKPPAVPSERHTQPQGSCQTATICIPEPSSKRVLTDRTTGWAPLC